MWSRAEKIRRAARHLTMSLAFILFFEGSAFAQKYTLSGYVADSASGEPLIGVAIVDRESGAGTVTSNAGYYSLSLDAGKHEISALYLGYEETTLELELASDNVVNLNIKEMGRELTGAVVTGTRNETGVGGTQMSAVEVPVLQLKSIPAIGGEVDIIKALQLLPGVQSGSEGTAGMYVRGGGADENLLLMDGVPLYSVNHLFGFFSVFNADALKNVTLYKGSFPARFGGHLSSVIDVRMKDGNDKSYHGSVSIGLISSKINVEGPVIKGRTTFNVSARRTYMDLITRPLIALANKRANSNSYYNEYSSTGNTYGGGYDFYDINAKVTHRFRNDDRLSLSFYMGDDKADFKLQDNNRYAEYVPDPETGGPRINRNIVNISRDKIDFGWKWGNLVAALKWNHSISPKLYSVSCLSYTRYRNRLSTGVDSYTSRVENGIEGFMTDVRASLAYDSKIDDICASQDFEWHPNISNDVKFGAVYIRHDFNPGIISLSEKVTVSGTPDVPEGFSLQVGDKPLFSNEAALYGEDNWAVTSWLKANLGLRASLYNISGKSYFSLEPRVSARALLSDKFSVKASYSEMSQYIHLLCNSNLSFPSDLWVPVTDRIKPMRSRQVAAGVCYGLGRFELSAEAYWKSMDNVLEYRDGASYMGTSTGWEDKVCMGRGWSYGLELLAQKKTGKLTGWVGYTLSRSMRQFDRAGNIINGGRPFPAKYDRRHDLSATATYAFSDRFDLSATFILASGNCGSLAMDEFDGAVLMDIDGYPDLIPSQTLTFLPERNNYRMPLYNRMDIGMNFRKPKKHGTSVWNISVYNVYNRLNPYLVYPSEEYVTNTKTGDTRKRKVLKQLSFFPILPSVSYTFVF